MRNILIIAALTSFTISCTPKEQSSTEKTKTVSTENLIEKTDQFFEDGAPEIVTKYTKGKNGNLIPHSRVNFYRDKKVMIEGTLDEKGERDGTWKSYYNNGSPWSEGDYKNGVAHGKRIVWFENGQKRYEGAFDNGQKIGKWKFWDENGELIKEVSF